MMDSTIKFCVPQSIPHNLIADFLFFFSFLPTLESISSFQLFFCKGGKKQKIGGGGGGIDLVFSSRATLK